MIAFTRSSATPARAVGLAPADCAKLTFEIGWNFAGCLKVIPIPLTSKVFSPPPPQPATANRASPARRSAVRRTTAPSYQQGRLSRVERLQRLVAGAVQLGPRLGRRLAVEEVFDLLVEQD